MWQLFRRREILLLTTILALIGVVVLVDALLRLSAPSPAFVAAMEGDPLLAVAEGDPPGTHGADGSAEGGGGDGSASSRDGGPVVYGVTLLLGRQPHPGPIHYYLLARLFLAVAGGTHDPVAGEGIAIDSPESVFDALGRLDLNRATADDLQTLPGVGPAIAARILSTREQRGGFVYIEELLDVQGIGPARFEQIRDLVFVGPATP